MSTTPAASARASAKPSPMIVFTPLFGAAAIASWISGASVLRLASQGSWQSVGYVLSVTGINGGLMGPRSAASAFGRMPRLLHCVFMELGSTNSGNTSHRDQPIGNEIGLSRMRSATLCGWMALGTEHGRFSAYQLGR